jgi:hypothetical protein
MPIKFPDKTSIYFFNNEKNEKLGQVDDAGLYCTDKEVQEYLDDKKQYEKDNVKSAYQRWQEAIKDAEMKNLWMKQFLDSLEMISNEMSVSEEGE